MTTVTTTTPFYPPAALALAFLPALPAIDRKPDRTSFAIPLCFYPGAITSPGEAVYAPTSPAEVTNFSNISYQEFDFTSGSTLTSTSITIPDYRGEVSLTTLTPYPSLTKYQSDVDTIKWYLDNKPITLHSVVEDSSHSWNIKMKNGVVYRDTTVKQSELDNVAENGTWLSAAGFADGDRVRLIYTIPYDSLWVNYDENGTKSYSGTEQRIFITNSEGIHIGNGDIALSDVDIVGLTRLVEVSSQGTREIFTGVVTGDYSSSGVTITNWNGKKGTFRISPAPADGAYLIVDYTKIESHITYRGFYDEVSNLWQGVDLNPQQGHVYNTGIDSPSRVNRDSEDLLYRPVNVYLLPTSAIKLDGEGEPVYPLRVYSAYVEGNKTGWWHSLRHYIPPAAQASSSGTISTRQIASWGYAQFDIDTYAEEQEFSASERGIPKELESAILIAQIRVLPKPQKKVEDARRFSGLLGIYDRKDLTGASEDPKSNRWDTSSWEGVSAPLAGTALIELSQSNIEAFGLEHLERVARKHLPPGIIPIIKAKS